MSEVPQTFSIDERLAAMTFPAPLIRQMNQAASRTAINLGLGQLGKDFPLAPEILTKLSHEQQLV